MVVAVGARPVAAATDDPRAVVETLNAALLDTMKAARGLDFRGRYDRLAPTLKRAFNFPVMSRVAAGAYWPGLSPAKRARMSEAFARMSIATFAARFDGYSGESFETLSAEPARRRSMLVKSRLNRGDHKPVALHYLLRSYAGTWRVVDVFLDAKYSELARQRAEFTSILRQAGFDGLMRAIDDKITRLASE